jgi:hypothetical protein
MNHDIANLLRESVDRLTEGATVPPGLAGRARRHDRQRMILLRTAGAAGTALAATAAVVVVSIGTNGHSSINPGANSGPRNGLSTRTTAYVTVRMSKAMAAAEREHVISEIRTTAHGAWFSLVERLLPNRVPPPQTSAPVRAGLDPGIFTSNLLTWVYRGQIRQQGFTADGRVLFNIHSTTVNTHRGAPRGLYRQVITNTGADYRARSWWRNSYVPSGYFGYGRPPSSCRDSTPGLQEPVPVAYIGPYDWSAAIRLDLSCGYYNLGGRQWVDGVSAIKLVAAKPLTGPIASQPVPVLVTIWVDTHTYLPVRVMWQWPMSHGKPDGVLVSDFSWLAPTKANIAALQVKVPQGFRKVTLRAGLPMFEFEISAQGS